FRHDYATVNVADLKLFEAGAQITPDVLVAQGFMTNAEGKGLVKILGDGELDRALTVRAHKFTAGARTKIEAAGGTVEIIPTKTYGKPKTKRRRDEEGKKVPAPSNKRA
ncbi:MAG TPA: uL15m family ribosomal protein, partial [Ktedonobacteraceae bacterium]|nr:uL15m family ribosomal protein [Ktedonobacteraceae bacterium]